MINPTEYILLGEEAAPPIFVKIEENVKEYGTVIGKIILE